MRARITKEEINRVYRESLKCPNCGSYELADTGMHACSGTAERPEFLEVEVDPIEEECRCKKLKRGDVVHVDENGRCVVCEADHNPEIKVLTEAKMMEELAKAPHKIEELESDLTMSSVTIGIIRKINELIREHNKRL